MTRRGERANSAIVRMIASGEWVSASVLPRLVGVSYRTIDYWIRQVPGVPQPVWHNTAGERIDPPADGRGQGAHRLFPAAEVDEFRSLAKLTALVNMPIGVAAEHPHPVRAALVDAIEAVFDHYYDGGDDDG